MAYKAALRVWRGDRGQGDLADYTVEVNEGEVVLDVLHRLQATQAGDLAIRWNCKAGKCGSCSMEINGRPRLACKRSQEFRKCIECYLCQNTCHVIRDHAENENNFAGPRFLMRIAELEMHPADTGDRREIAQDDFGLGYCNITKCCTEVCPENIKITDNALIPLKERVVGRKYDPLVWLGSKITRRPRGTDTPKVPGKQG
jgi:succinate dehydrogenase/fumarate reductase-like Fe-S protein